MSDVAEEKIPCVTVTRPETHPGTQPPLTRDQAVRALTAVSHMLEAAAHLLMIGKDAPARDLIAEANVVMEHVPDVGDLK